jgi:hypothetical protein
MNIWMHDPSVTSEVSVAPCFACADFLNFLAGISLQYYWYLYSVFHEHLDAWSLCNQLGKVSVAPCFACANFF